MAMVFEPGKANGVGLPLVMADQKGREVKRHHACLFRAKKTSERVIVQLGEGQLSKSSPGA